MKPIKVHFWLLLLVILLALILVPQVESQRWPVAPSPGVVFLGWLDRADCVQIRMPNGNLVTYGGDKLEKIVAELKQWQAHAPKAQPDEGATKENGG